MNKEKGEVFYSPVLDQLVVLNTYKKGTETVFADLGKGFRSCYVCKNAKKEIIKNLTDSFKIVKLGEL